MKKIFLLVLTIFISVTQIFAQPSGQSPVQGRPPANAAKNGHIFGKVVDSRNKGISDASILVLQSNVDKTAGKNKDVLLKGTVTKSNGEFDFEELPAAGNLTLQISVTGFKAIEQSVSFTPPSSEKDLGKIILTAEAQELEGVVVTSAKSLMTLDIDKKVFNVEKNIVSEGGTAVDVMKNVPSVNVDIDGNISLRNSAPQVFVDGRPTTLTLEQIPANAIESVEVITNPSAKYDASGGGAGIINIVLKKNKKTGYNGNIRAGVNKYGAVDAGADLNVRQNKINFNAGLNVRQANSMGTSTIERTGLAETPVTTTNQFNTDKNAGTMLFGRVGLDYFITNKTTLSISGMKMHGEMNPNSSSDINTDSLYSTGILSSFSQRNTIGNRVFDGQGLVLGMKHLFAKEGEEWTADVNYFTGKMSNNSLYTTDYYSASKSSDILNSLTQKIVSGGSDKNIILKTDYVKPFGSLTKLETGIRAAIKSVENTNSNFILDNTSGNYILLPSSASNYKSTDNVYAAYASLTSSVGNFGYKFGLRAESSMYNGQLTDTKQTFSNKYPISLFPSLFLSQKLKNNQEIQLSYTRRVNRPNFFQLIPFVDSTDKLNIRQGNPNLVPEFTQSLEMNYVKQFNGNNTLLTSLYYKKTNNLITSYLTQQTDANGNTALVNSYINANSSYSTGAEITLQNTLTKWWNISTDVNIYNSKINATNVSNTAVSSMWSWFGKLNSNFKLPSNFSLQLSGMYQSKTNLPINTNQGGPGNGPPGMMAQSASQGYINAFYGVDLAVKKSFLNNKASISLSVNDIFRSRKQDQYSYSNYFTQEYSRLRDPQMFRLNLAYSFGKIDASLFKRKSQGTGQTGSDMQ